MMDERTSAVFFHLLRIGLQQEGVDRAVFESIDGGVCWDDIFELGMAQGVAAIQYDGLRLALKAKALPEVMMPTKRETIQFYMHSLQTELNWQQQEKVIGALAKFYASHNIKMMLLKGFGLSLLYPNPKHRPWGDIDIYLYGEQERADRLLAEEEKIKVEYGHHHHTVFYVDDTRVENHYDFVNMYSHLSNREVERELKRFAKEVPGEEVLVKGEKIYLPPATMNALFQLRHTSAHFAGTGISLRHFVDWTLFVQRYGKEIDWEWLTDFVKNLNMHRFLACMNGLCVEHFGLKSDAVPALDYDKATADRIMEDILYSPYADEYRQGLSLVKDGIFRLRRWWNNRWKRRIVYREGVLVTFMVQIIGKLLTPRERKKK